MSVAELQELEEIKGLLAKGQQVGVLTHAEIASAIVFNAGVYGYHSGSDFWVGSRGETIVSVRQYLRMPPGPWRQPMPESFQPPIGTSRWK